MSRPSLKEGQIKLSDGTHSYTLQLVDGINGLRETGSQPSTLNIVGGGEKFGDFEPNFSHYEQRAWNGGRGNENFVDDKARFSDSQMAWTWGDKVLPAPKARYAKGIRDFNSNLSDSMTWYSLIGTNLYMAVSFTGTVYNADKAYLWIRKRGTPGTLTMSLCSDSSGPSTALKTVTKTAADITDTLSVLQVFDWASTQALSATTFWVKIYGASTDDTSGHWEVGCDASTSGKISSDGTTWVTSTYSPCYRIVDADTSRKWLPFVLEGAQYIVTDLDSWGNSTVYINGDRGTATSATATTLVDSGKSWTADRYINAWVKITDGTGVGQARQITDNDGTSLTVATWDRTPSTDSEYVIYKTPWWSTTTIGTTGLGHVKSVCVVNNIAYFAQGSATNVRRCYWTGTTHSWAADGTNRADILYKFYDPVDGAQIWKALNGTAKTIARASVQAWGTDLVFGDAITVGSIDYDITGLIDYNNNLWVGKENGIWNVADDTPQALNVGLYGLPSKYTCAAMAPHGLFLFFSWWKSIERLYGGTLDDVGPWKGEGLPSARDGNCCALAPLMTWMFCGIDAGSTGNSSVLIYQDGGYHECYRAPYGERVRNVFVQPNDETNPWLWINVGGDLVYQEYSLTPLKESSFAFHHEYTVVSSTHDAGHAETYKFWKDLSIASDNLNTTGIDIGCDFQTDNDVGTSTWNPIETILYSPSDTVEIGIGEVNRIRYRLRANTNTSTTPPVIKGVVLKGYEVLPVKRLWTMRLKASTIRRNGRSVDGDELYKWWWNACQKAQKIEMETVIPGINKVFVKLEPPTWGWQFINRVFRWAGQFVIVAREM